MLRTMAAIVAVAIAGSSAVAVASPPTTASAADDRLATSSVSTFKLQPAEGRVAVSIDLRVTNTGGAGDAARSFPLVVQKGASDLRVDGQRARIRQVEERDVLDRYEVTYPKIKKGQTRQLTISYELPAAEAESEEPTRVSDAYAHFCWHGQATDETEVKAILPAGYQPDVLPEGVAAASVDGRTKLTPAGEAYDRWVHCVESSQPSELLEETVVADSGEEIVVEGWPEDPEWVEAVVDQIEIALPVLTEWVDLPLPHDVVTIRQSSTQALGGFDGTFDHDEELIRVGESVEYSTVPTHELAHAWFNQSTMGEMWMIEGGAEWAAKRTHGFDCQDPDTFDPAGRASLRNWGVAALGDAGDLGDLVSYQYAAACWIHQEVTEAIGADGMADVNHALIERLPKYGVSGDTAAGKPDWREWLDAVDEVGLVPAGETDLEFAERLLQRFGVAQPDELAGRSDARGWYRAAIEAWGDDVPVVISRAMDDWDFDAAMAAIEVTDEIMGVITVALETVPRAEVRAFVNELAVAETVAALEELRQRAGAMA